MKSYFVLLIYFITSLAFSQNQHALTVSLTDAETGKNVTDAKVFLEGFEIEPIKGKYDKKTKCYYFDKIPKGYNTVMAYHKKYNEKGYQDMNGLPERVTLKLFDPSNVSYSFEQDPYKSPVQKVYIEDPYKFGITSSKDVDYNTFRKYLSDELKKLDLEVELVNPFLELEKNGKIPKKFRGRLHPFEDKEFYGRFNLTPQSESYPFISTYPLVEIDQFILPLLTGISTYEDYLNSKGVPTIDLKNATVVFYIRKKNGGKFKRYNDPFLKKIRQIKEINTFSVLYYKYDFKSDGNRVYKNRYSRDLDKFNTFKDIDSSKIFYYFRANPDKSKNRPAIPCVKLEFHNFAMLESLKKEYGSSSKLDRILKYSKMLDFDTAIGLGALDQYERIGDSLKLNQD
ncbi:MAG: hypothetical protein QM710_14915 [Flavobacterium sp.]